MKTYKSCGALLIEEFKKLIGISKSKTCKNCGAQLADNATFCGECGEKNPIDSAAVNIDTQNTQKKHGHFWNILHYNELEKTVKKKLLFGGFAVLALVIIIPLSIMLFENLFPSIEINANKFVSAWNKSADISNGVKIDSSVGEHMYDLGNDCNLTYTVNKRGFFGKTIRVIKYCDPDFLSHDYYSVSSEFLSTIHEISNPEEAVKELNSKFNDYVQSGVEGIIISRSDSSHSVEVKFNYAYMQGLSESDITGLSFSSDLESSIDRFEQEYESAINSKYNFKINPSDEECINCASTIITNALKAPETANLVDTPTVEKDDYGRAMVLLTVDAQNSFGAYIRNSYCVIIQGIKFDGEFSYNHANYFAVYNKSNKDTIITLLKKENRFGKSRNEITKSTEDFKKEKKQLYSFYSDGEIDYYVDNKTEKVFAVNVNLQIDNIDDDTIKTVKRYCNIALGSVTSTSSAFEDGIKQSFDFSKMKPIQAVYKNGILYLSKVNNNDIKISVIAVDKIKYDKIKDLIALNETSIVNIIDYITEKQDNIKGV